MQSAQLKIYESRVVFDANGNPVRQPGTLVDTTKVSGNTVDKRVRAARAYLRSKGHKRCSVSCADPNGMLLVANYTVGLDQVDAGRRRR